MGHIEDVTKSRLYLIHNAQCKIHNYGYFSAEAEKSKNNLF